MEGLLQKCGQKESNNKRITNFGGTSHNSKKDNLIFTEYFKKVCVFFKDNNERCLKKYNEFHCTRKKKLICFCS